MSILLRFLLFISLVSFVQLGLSAQSDWQLETSSDGIDVYLKDSPTSSVKEVKIIAILDANLSTVVSVLKDVPAYTQWIYKCTDARRLKPSTSHSSLYYSKVDFPWPMSDRDFIAKSKLWQDENTKHVFIEVKGQPDYLPHTPDLVRMGELYIKYQLIPLSTNKVKMIYYLHSEPGGDIPAWLTNMVIENGPVNTVKAMKQKTQEAKYRQAQLSYLED